MSKETTTAGTWSKFEHLYIIKTLINQRSFKGMLFGFKMRDDNNNEKYIDEFTKMVIDLESIGVKVEDEDQTIMILNSQLLIQLLLKQWSMQGILSI